MECTNKPANGKTPQYHGQRRIIQFATLLLILLIPALGIFRIDLTTASFSILGRQIEWSNFSLVLGLAIVAFTAPIITYMTIGTLWCGWACPQNLLSEWANSLTHRLLGKRASVDVAGEGLKVSASKNKLINWLILGANFLAASLALAFIPFLFFYSPAEVWAFVTSSLSAKLSVFMRQLYFFTAFLIFIDIAVIRYFWCDYFCLYRIGQKIFKSRDALHVAYDQSRSSDCTKCNYCATSCITGIEPTRIEQYDSCINCGECIDACNRLHAKSGTGGLLCFKLGETDAATTWRQKIKRVLARSNWLVVGIFLLGVAMIGWGFHSIPEKAPEVPAAVQQRFMQLQKTCSNQCSAEQAACSGSNLAGCYRMSACKCECFLEHEPQSPSASEWQQCVRTNREKAGLSGSAPGKLPLQ